jgi:A/G-specific adenine glycosylase
MDETRSKLIRWYRRRKRDLPWRRTRDPYAIWLSEIMLQQTRVAAVVPYFERFLRRLPDAGALARARPETVLALWSGLGYYRRARMLHAAAKRIARDGFPRTAATLRTLPGVGEYTANAVASIAFGERVAVVDGNVERVLSRLHAIEGGRARVRELADAWLAPRAPGDHNQAVMELGATVCTPRAPRCAECPVRAHCRGRDAPERYPAPRPRARPVAERRRVAYVRRNGKVLLRRNGDGGRLAALWDLPPAEGGGPPLATVRHSILDRRLTITVHEGPGGRGGRWFTPRQARALPLAAAARKCLESVGFVAARRVTPAR